VSEIGDTYRTCPRSCLTVSWILSQFSDDLVRARSLYRKFVLDGVDHDGLWHELKGQTLLGTEGFSEQIAEMLGGLNDVDEIPRNERLINRPKIEELFDVSTMSDKLSRNNKLVEAVEKYGYTQKELADHLGLHYSTISRLIKSAMSKVKT